MLVCTLFFVALIFIYLRRKKNAFEIQKGIKKSLELWISKILLTENENEAEATYFDVPLKFQEHFKNSAKREFTVNQLIDIKKNLTGKVINNIIHLYGHLGFKRDSIKKMKSNIWYKKVKGINELFMMEQNDMLDSISKYTNSHNEYVRAEAQTAMIHFHGFEGLSFLDEITHPISEWEQLKLLEQLKNKDCIEMPNFAPWLKSSNNTVMIFALKLAFVYQQYEVHDEVVECLKHDDEKVRVQAVRTLCRIAREDTASILANHYSKEHFTNRQNILNCLLTIASDNEKDFLVSELNDQNDFLKTAAARVLAKCCTNGLGILVNKARQQPYPYQNIYFHIKSELQV
jgi:hypothetical protein